MGNINENARGRLGVLNRQLTPRSTTSSPTDDDSTSTYTIYYTYTDEAPLLATYSFLPIATRFAAHLPHVRLAAADISVAQRILALFPDQQTPDTLQRLGHLANTSPRCTIIKLPNVSASLPQLLAAIKELQAQGHRIPDYEAAKERYAGVLGSAVNPVLREGNSDRRVAAPVKEDAKRHPHRMMKPYPKESRSSVAHMHEGDFYGSEQSVIMEKAGRLRFELVTRAGEVIPLRGELEVLQHEVLDSSLMSVRSLRSFYREEIDKSMRNKQDEDVLLSLHLKATMMKVSDPIMFGHFVSIYFEKVFEKHAETFLRLGVSPNYGIADLLQRLGSLPEELRAEIVGDITIAYATRPELAMVDSDRGITNLHVPSDVIIDASMPVVVRDGGRMYGRDGRLKDVKCLIPDRAYAACYKTVLAFCKQHGSFDPSTMGSVANVGLMARKAEEYGSHDKTFELPEDGTVRIRDAASGRIIFQHDNCEAGDIYRMCQTKDDAIVDWIKLALRRGALTGLPVVFWLDRHRAHDRSLIDIINFYMANASKDDHDGCDWSIKDPEEAMELTLRRCKAGLDTISATGNVLRDYLTDLFPILELGTSAKMLSIVPLLAQGGLYETGAGGSAPKHVHQFLTEGHLRWDSLGEFLALAVSLEDVGRKSGDADAVVLGESLNIAVGKLLAERRSPSRKVGELDNRGSHFYLAMYWAEAMAQNARAEQVRREFAEMHQKLGDNEQRIVGELLECQGRPVDIGGYYKPDPAKVERAMRPSRVLNDIIG